MPQFGERGESRARAESRDARIIDRSSGSDKLALLLLGLSAAAYLASALWLRAAHDAAAWLLLYALCWLGYVVLCQRERLPTARWLFGAALVFRLLLVFGEPWLSDDLYRYLLDGRALRAGIHPYRHAPDAAAMQELAPELAARVNHPELPTIYPPLVPAVAALAPWDVDSWRVLIALLDLATMAAVGSLFRSRRAAAVYGLCPLAIFESGGNGHLEALLLLCWVLAVRALQQRRYGRAALFWWLATTCKYLPLATALLWLRSSRARLAFLVAALASAATLWPFLRGGVDPFASLRVYWAHWQFNAPVHAGLLALGLPAPLARAVPYAVVALLAAVGVWRRRDALWLLPRLIFVFLLLGPTLHPWYALWVLPWLGERPHRGLWAFVFAMGLSYAVWWQVARGLGWSLLPWQQVVIWSLVSSGWLLERWRPARGRAPLPAA